MARATKALTQLGIDRLKPPAEGVKRYEVWDNIVSGFGVRVNQTGSKSYIFRYRSRKDGKQYRILIGNAKDMTLAPARDAAKLALKAVKDGEEPGAPVPPPEPEPVVAPRLLRDVLTAYLARRRPNLKKSTADEAERALRLDLEKTLGDRPIDSITKKDIHTLLDSIIDRGSPVHANRVLVLTRTFFGWCVERGEIAVSPVDGIKKPTKETERERVLDRSELVRVWRAAEVLGHPFGPVLQLLILTAQRGDEVADMSWTEIDFDRAVWTLPSVRSKNSRAHEIALSPEAIAIIKDCPHHKTSALLFTTTKEGKTAASGWSRMKRKLDWLLMAPGELVGPPMPVPPYTLHDLRRSAATAMADLGTPPHIVDKILNHTTGTIKGVAAIYNRHPYTVERRAALEAWSRHLLDLIEGRAGNVVTLQRA